MSDLITLEELCGRVERRLAEMGLLDAQGDGRVSAAPDARTVRYYGTLGLVDRPRIVDREARYGGRQVLQVVAVKALQALGLPLAEVQARLYGRSNPELETLLRGVAEERRGRTPPLRALTWREVALEPGLKLMVEESWSPRTSREALEDRIRAALAALAANGGAKS
jgi:DNA-binding transcriptional MerR regulator